MDGTNIGNDCNVKVAALRGNLMEVVLLALTFLLWPCQLFEDVVRERWRPQ